MARNCTASVLSVLLCTSLWAADHTVSIASVASGNANPWQWTVFIKGTSDAIAHVACVQYVLDPSFSNPHRTVCNRGAENEAFLTSGITWGPFNLSATVIFDDKTVQQFQYALNPPTRFQREGWQPRDLASNPDSGLFALDSHGGVSRLVVEQGRPRIEELFSLSASDSGYALAASAESVFVSSNSELGCTVFKYAITSKTVSRRLVAMNLRCASVAVDGTGGFYVTIPDRKEIRHWDRWDTRYARTWNLSDIDIAPYLLFDEIGHRLILADVSGKAYAISVPDGRKQLLASNLGAVRSIATSRSHIMLASGKKVLFLDRSDNQGGPPPPGLQLLTGGHIVGVAVDASDSLWFADDDNKIVEGPFPLG